MLAKILSDGRVYHSPVFAVSMKYPCQAVVFDSSFSELIVVDVFRDNKYTLLFLNFDTDGFSIDNSQFKSLWNDKNIFWKIRRKKYTPKMLADAKKILRANSFGEFTSIEKSSDIDALSLNSGSFHDGYVLGIHEENSTTEILLDTSWGAFIVLRCKEVIKNDLQLGRIFSHCDIRIDNDCVEFSFVPMFGMEDLLLIAKHVEFKSIFERRIDLKKFEYRFDDNKLALKTNAGWVKIDGCDDVILDFKQRRVLGYMQNDDIRQRCVIFKNDIAYSFYKYVYNKKRQQNTAHKVLTFQNQCKEHGFCFDQYPADDDVEKYEYDFGKVIYKHEYSAMGHLISILQDILPLLILYNGIWLTIQPLNPEMEWIIYFVMGLGSSVIAVIALLIGFIKEKLSSHQNTKCLEICENGIKNNGYNRIFHVDYGSVVDVEYTNRIIVCTTWCKYKLQKFKDDKVAYELIKEQLSKFKKE
ncbi:MAG: hypothetical protein IJF10_03920 [Clostridia bacterium]|nr:hypothetical protein [Clostridia bacterium]